MPDHVHIITKFYWKKITFLTIFPEDLEEKAKDKNNGYKLIGR